MKAVAETLGVARSNLADRIGRGERRPRPPYRKAGDAELLAELRRFLDARPTYGYRRLAALLNRERRAAGAPTVNAKRVLRVLRANGLTLQAHTARRPGRTHDGVVVALPSNIRWCSDHLEVSCRDGAIVRVPFAIDARDREVIAWSATTAGISGEMVQDPTVTCVERRFGTASTASPVEWLADNGAAYTATALGLRLAFTPPRSPEGNGIAEAFVKTLGRDYARVTILPDAPTTLALVPGWITDYNTSHPHSGLRMLSPQEFRARYA